MVNSTLEMLDRWDAFARSSEPFDAAAEMARLTADYRCQGAVQRRRE